MKPIAMTPKANLLYLTWKTESQAFYIQEHKHENILKSLIRKMNMEMCLQQYQAAFHK